MTSCECAFLSCDWSGYGLFVLLLLIDLFLQFSLRYTDKYEFPKGGTAITPPHQLNQTFKFKDYAPTVFRRIRERFGIDSAEYMLSLCGIKNFIPFSANSKSGQFFFFSHDRKFMIKTQTKVTQTRYFLSQSITCFTSIDGVSVLETYLAALCKPFA